MFDGLWLFLKFLFWIVLLAVAIVLLIYGGAGLVDFGKYIWEQLETAEF